MGAQPLTDNGALRVTVNWRRYVHWMDAKTWRLYCGQPAQERDIHTVHAKGKGRSCLKCLRVLKKKMPKPKPLPCPFCGKKPRKHIFCDTENGKALVCPSCGADGPGAGTPWAKMGSAKERMNHQKAIEAWNRRAVKEWSPRS